MAAERTGEGLNLFPFEIVNRNLQVLEASFLAPAPRCDRGFTPIGRTSRRRVHSGALWGNYVGVDLWEESSYSGS